uniref:Uncharacterized protein n=1 Tax=Arundo donax TaxID=35708 RepID=A0A0A8Z319_ARUDO
MTVVALVDAIILFFHSDIFVEIYICGASSVF